MGGLPAERPVALLLLTKGQMEQFENLTDEESARLVPEDLVMLGYRGSLSHGTYLKPNDTNSVDDKDIMGAFIAPLDHYFGASLFNNKFRKDHHEAMIKEWDAVSYEFRKFVGLLAASNPNVMSMLWMPCSNFLVMRRPGTELIMNRHLFVTKKIFDSFTGYARAQLEKMTSFTHEGYMGEKRRSLVAKYGYDCKNASHLIRLLRMGIEFLREGRLNVFRKDAAELVEIKTGGWSLDRVKSEAAKLFEQAEKAHDECTFPAEPDQDAINDLMVRILSSHFGMRTWPSS